MEKRAHANGHQLLCGIILAGAAILAACGHDTAPAPVTTSGPAGRTAATPAANAPLPAQTFSLAAGLDMAKVQVQPMIHPQFSLTPPEVDTPVIFAVVRNEEKGLASPVLLKKMDSGWRVTEVPQFAAAATQREWVHAAACPARHELFALLDDSSESRAWALTLLHSTDGGATWATLAAVKKPTNAAEYAGFAMGKNGAGRISMHLDDDTDKLGHGYYHYATTDGGKTWTGPTFEPDDIVDADPQAEDDAIGDAMKAAEAIPAP
jgi:hypothetical protein